MFSSAVSLTVRLNRHHLETIAQKGNDLSALEGSRESQFNVV
jgi:hypothetical protein